MGYVYRGAKYLRVGGEPVGKEPMFYYFNLSDYEFCQASSLGTAY